ncbi:Rv3235 family protein [Leucobacter sp. USCH14]|uniref:Rv3235 family protein n=1 Tax=Leucobacter sp. USCH14 TaxID=3024838 RepID=UPI0030985D6B
MPASAPSPEHRRAIRAASQSSRAGAQRHHLRAVPKADERAGVPPSARPRSSALLRDRGAILDAPAVAPPPDAFVQRLAVYAFEVLEGVRSVAQFGGWITPEVAAAFRARRALRAERESLMRDRRRRTATPGRAHLTSPLPHIIEATVVLHTDVKSHVVAIRLEHLRDRWRATDITVL